MFQDAGDSLAFFENNRIRSTALVSLMEMRSSSMIVITFTCEWWKSMVLQNHGLSYSLYPRKNLWQGHRLVLQELRWSSWFRKGGEVVLKWTSSGGRKSDDVFFLLDGSEHQGMQWFSNGWPQQQQKLPLHGFSNGWLQQKRLPVHGFFCREPCTARTTLMLFY